MPKWVENLSKVYKEVTPQEFYRVIFPEGELDSKNSFKKGKFVGVACEFTGLKKSNGKPLVKRYSITDDLEVIDKLLKSNNFIIISPISYVGKSRITKHAVKMYAFAIEIDNLKVSKDGRPVGLNDLLHHFDIELLPYPNYIVASGNGLHLYYVLEFPLMLFDNVKHSLIKFKKDITSLFWNRYVTFDYKEEKIQYESPFQGFRMVGGVTKKGERTRVFEVSTHPVTVEYLNEFVREKGNEIIPAYASELSLTEAKDKYPEWYEKRIINKQPKGTWICKRDLYDWWKQKIQKASVGHRYNCLFCLAIYAIKCGISQDELEKDMFSYLKPYDDMSEDETNRFTVKDIADALQAFEDKDLITYPINSIAKRSGFTIKKNRRNYRKRDVHIKTVNAMRKFRRDELGEDEYKNNGRPKGSGTAESKVKLWRADHPNGKKADCIRDTGLTKPTVYKWWD